MKWHINACTCSRYFERHDGAPCVAQRFGKFAFIFALQMHNDVELHLLDLMDSLAHLPLA